MKFPYNLDTTEKKKKFLKKIRISFLIPLFIFVSSIALILAIPLSETSNFNFILGLSYLIGSVSLQLFLLGFWIMNLIVAFNSKQWIYFVLAIPIPLVAFVFYLNQFYPYLNEDHWSKI